MPSPELARDVCGGGGAPPITLQPAARRLGQRSSLARAARSAAAPRRRRCLLNLPPSMSAAADIRLTRSPKYNRCVLFNEDQTAASAAETLAPQRLPARRKLRLSGRGAGVGSDARGGVSMPRPGHAASARPLRGRGRRERGDRRLMVQALRLAGSGAVVMKSSHFGHLMQLARDVRMTPERLHVVDPGTGITPQPAVGKSITWSL
jgi:hypothetical protein